MGNDERQDSDGPMTDPEFIASLLAEITRSEQHFNTLEVQYRKLASTWLLAAFAGMGYIATAKDLPLPVGPTIFVLALGASLGIQLLWIVDLLTYHRLLLANFVEGWRLERMHKYLPQIRGNMLAQGNTGKRVRLFYLGSSLVPLAFGVGGYFAINHVQASRMADTLVLIATGVLIASSALLMATTQGSWWRAQIARLGGEQPGAR